MSRVAIALAIIVIVIVLCVVVTEYLRASTIVEHSSYMPERRSDMYDFIVCGIGTSGAIVARQLADHGFRVLAIERGLDQQNNEDVQNGSVPFLVAESSSYAQVYQSEPYTTISAPFFKRIPVTLGKMIGGSSGINYTVYVRPSAQFHEELARIADSHLYGYDNYVKYYKEVETYNGVSQRPSQRGEHGLMTITQLRGAGTDFGEWLRDLASATSSSFVEDYNVGEDLVASPYVQASIAIRENILALRQWSGQYLQSAPDNLVTITSADVLRVLFDKHMRAYGVEVVEGSSIKTYKCRREVVLSAGIESSLILERSGIGNSDILERYGIKTLVDNKNVGENFKNHGGGDIIILMGSTVAPQALAPLFAYVDDEGFTDSSRRNLELLFTNLEYGVPVEGVTPIRSVIWNINPRTSGSVHITGPGIQQPIIKYENIDDLIVVARYVIDVLVPHLRMQGPSNLHIGPIVNIPQQLLQSGQYQALAQWFYDNQVPGAHYTGQCSIGTVVDSHLRVIGSKNVRVIDNSVFPISVPGNTMASAQGIGVFGADIIRKYHS